jgi:hypothetical protein
LCHRQLTLLTITNASTMLYRMPVAPPTIKAPFTFVSGDKPSSLAVE